MSFALAHEGATGVVKERMDLMKDQQKQMKLIGDMVKGKTHSTPPRQGRPQKNSARPPRRSPSSSRKGAAAIRARPSMPYGRSGIALPATLTTPKKQPTRSPRLSRHSGQDWKAAFKTMTDACKSCHEDFRAKESEHDQMDHEHHE